MIKEEVMEVAESICGMLNDLMKSDPICMKGITGYKFIITNNDLAKHPHLVLEKISIAKLREIEVLVPPGMNANALVDGHGAEYCLGFVGLINGFLGNLGIDQRIGAVHGTNGIDGFTVCEFSEESSDDDMSEGD